MLKAATAVPALHTIDVLRGEECERFATFAISRLSAHVHAETMAKGAQPTSPLAEKAVEAGRLLWLLPSLITRDCLVQEQGDF